MINYIVSRTKHDVNTLKAISTLILSTYPMSLRLCLRLERIMDTIQISPAGRNPRGVSKP
jgi:hypothetical protein